MVESGTLYICPTPIGNLGDMTLRVLETLRQVDFIAAEDTRHSRKLLDHYKIDTALLSYHEHNERLRTEEIIARLRQGHNGALISDAGMPGISDPGEILIKRCIAEELKIDVLPGPNAAVTALVLSGLPADSFLYLGFLPMPKGERKRRIEQFARLPYTVVLYEAPHRLTRTLEDIKQVVGARNVVVTRELTKIHQSVYRGSIDQLIEKFRQTPPKGECCLLLEPYTESIDQGNPQMWLADLEKLQADGMDSKEAMKMVAKRYGISKRDIYKENLDKQANKKGRP